VGTGAGGPHVADESLELDRGCDSVLWCGLPLLRGVDTGGVDLPEVWTSLLILHTLIVASALLHAQLSTTKCKFYPCILDSTTAFALCWEADMTYPLIG
jgi:hypothetical protein